LEDKNFKACDEGSFKRKTMQREVLKLSLLKTAKAETSRTENLKLVFALSNILKQAASKQKDLI